MQLFKFGNRDTGTPIILPDVKKIWMVCAAFGVIFWITAVILWGQVEIDKAILFYYDSNRIAYDPVVAVSKWLSSNGMAAISVLFVVYLFLSKKIKLLDAPVTVFFYTICSYAFSGIAGDLLKEVFARPRPVATYGNEILAISAALTPAIPSGHATKSIALVLPFILLVSNAKDIHKVIKIVIGITAVGVCFSRIVLGAHYLSDVLAGIGTALIGLPLTMMFANMVLRKMKQEQLPSLSIVWGFLLIFLTLVFLVL